MGLSSATDDDFMPPPNTASPSSAAPLRGAASSQINPSTTPVLRRSSRVRNRPQTSFAIHVDDESPPKYSGPRRLEQIPYSSVTELGIESENVSGMKVRIHPMAAMLMNVHSHLTKVEVIGYLGGTVYRPIENPSEIHVVIVEAFATRSLTERELGRTGRNAYMEVEMDPASSVEVMDCITAKGLQVVGWYHSHPDACFTVEPSRVDIENQSNYQRLLYKDIPFVAAIIAPYNQDLPDHCSALEFFSVWGQDVPLRLPYAVDTLAQVPMHVLSGYWGGRDRHYPLATVSSECRMLVNQHKTSQKRVRLSNEWRSGRSCADKLRGALMELVQVCRTCETGHTEAVVATTNGQPSHGNQTGDDEIMPQENGNGEGGTPGVGISASLAQVESFRQCVEEVIIHAEEEYTIVAEREKQERAERKRRNAAQRSKRSRRR